MKLNTIKVPKTATSMRNYSKNFEDKRQALGKSRSTVPVYNARLKSPEKTDSASNTGVRAALVNMGIDNSKIGWQDGYVTYGDMKFKPASVEDGTSFAPRSDIQGFANSIYKAQGKDPIRATDYAAPSGLGSLSYSDNGQVSVGGENIPVLYMDGDRAVVDRADLDRAYAKLKNQTGIKSQDELLKSWGRNYKNELKNGYEALADFGDWRYNPAQDPAYKAYSDMYTREGERAFRDAAAKLALSNNGNMTSAAQTLAAQQLGYYMSRLADKIPELEKLAYERYKNSFDMKERAYESLQKEADSAWKRTNESNEAAKQDYHTWEENERKRSENAMADAAALAKLEAQRQENAQAEYNNAWENAQRRGFFTDPEAVLWNIEKNENGSYKTPNDIKIGTENQYFNETTAPQLDYKSRLEYEAKVKELEQKLQNDLTKAAQDFNYDKQLAAYKASLKPAKSATAKKSSSSSTATQGKWRSQRELAEKEAQKNGKNKMTSADTKPIPASQAKLKKANKF